MTFDLFLKKVEIFVLFFSSAKKYIFFSWHYWSNLGSLVPSVIVNSLAMFVITQNASLSIFFIGVLFGHYFHSLYTSLHHRLAVDNFFLMVGREGGWRRHFSPIGSQTKCKCCTTFQLNMWTLQKWHWHWTSHFILYG